MTPKLSPVSIDSADLSLYEVQTHAAGPGGSLPLDADFLLNAPSGDIFGLSQNVGHGLEPPITAPQRVFNPQHPGRHVARPMAAPLLWAITPAIGKWGC